MSETPTVRKRGRPAGPDGPLTATERSRLRRDRLAEANGKLVKVPIAGEGLEQLVLARSLFGAKTDAQALQRALAWAVTDAGQHLTPERRAEIIAAGERQ